MIRYNAVTDGILTGSRAEKMGEYVTRIGTFDGTGPDFSPVGLLSSELIFMVSVPEDGTYQLLITYATGEEEGVGSWIQVGLGDAFEEFAYNDLVPQTDGPEDFHEAKITELELKAGEHKIRIMNHRRQENTLGSYGTLMKAFDELAPGREMLLSLCEWGKTQPHNWGYKVGDSWRILNDITFQVGADGDPGQADWKGDYTNNLTAQYNKAVIMDEFAGLDKGWNDPDMMLIGMNGFNETQNKTHMTMWCMMNSPLMLGLDLRRVEKGDALWNIIANPQLIALNQDPLGIQAKRIYVNLKGEVLDDPDTSYIRDIDRVDILAKPLQDGAVALAFINVSEEKKCGCFGVDVDQIVKAIGKKLPGADAFAGADSYDIVDLWNGEKRSQEGKLFEVKELDACDSIVLKVSMHG